MTIDVMKQTCSFVQKSPTFPTIEQLCALGMAAQLLPTDLPPRKCLEVSVVFTQEEAGQEERKLLSGSVQAKLKLVTKKGRCRHELGANAVKSLFVCDPDVSDTSVLD